MTRLLGAFVSAVVAGAAAAGDDPEPKPNAPYVEFDFSSLPREGRGPFSYTITVLSADKDLKYSMETKGDDKSKLPGPAGECFSWATSFRINDWKVERVDKTKLRVYGRMFNDKLIPATEGKVESPNMKKEELPKVKNPPKA